MTSAEWRACGCPANNQQTFHNLESFAVPPVAGRMLIFGQGRLGGIAHEAEAVRCSHGAWAIKSGSCGQTHASRACMLLRKYDRLRQCLTVARGDAGLEVASLAGRVSHRVCKGTHAQMFTPALRHGRAADRGRLGCGPRAQRAGACALP